MLDAIAARFRDLKPAVDFCSLRFVATNSQELEVRKGVLQPPTFLQSQGAMLTVHDGGGAGYAATVDLSPSGLAQALSRARDWARVCRDHGVTDFSALPMPASAGEHHGPVQQRCDSVPLAARIERLQAADRSVNIDDRIVDRSASVWSTEEESLYLTSEGGRVYQQHAYLVPQIEVVASSEGDSQLRTLGGRGFCRQAGWDLLDTIDFDRVGPRLAEDALTLLAAPDCPTERMDLLLAPDQMLIQIHESIGHPLELDRILGDERNYAGTSFVTLDMFGSYQYGSELLDVSYDPDQASEFASFGFDDEGLPAKRQWVIRKGVLQRPLGGVISQHRARTPGVACARASSWNRPAIDRMANLNVEPGERSLEEMVAGTERGVLMRSNRSWSIDDSRNKFQFGCEWGQLIENGELTAVVKNPNYRGISATFWRNLVGVGNRDTRDVLGSPFCGKGEPNQLIRVGHASPACLFRGVDVFGGAG